MLVYCLRSYVGDDAEEFEGSPIMLQDDGVSIKGCEEKGIDSGGNPRLYGPTR